MPKRLATVLIALIAFSAVGYAQQGTVATPQKPAAEQAHKAGGSSPADASLIGLTKAQVQARLGKPSIAFATVWAYSQPEGTLRVSFKDGVVTDAKRSAPPTTASTTGKGYTNADGNRIPSPRKADAPPPGASAQCRDGSYSFSANRRGTCSHHGGVARWL